MASPFDENALELAIRLKGSHGGTVTILSAGKNISRAVMLKAMACGADELFLVEDQGFDPSCADSFQTASVLASAIERIGEYDLILTGRQASDTNAGQVGMGLAVLLGIPGLLLARSAEVVDGRIEVERIVPDGYEVVSAAMPVVLTVSHEAGDLRYPKIADIKSSKSRPRTVLSVSDLGVDLAAARRLELVALSTPVRERKCRLIDGESEEEAGEKLAVELREAGVV